MRIHTYLLVPLVAAFFLLLQTGPTTTLSITGLFNLNPAVLATRQEKVVLPPGTKVLYDIPYIDNGHKQQKLDLFLPEGNNVRPLAIFIHGGGFSGGDKNKISPADLQELLKAGVAVASLNYRFYNDAPLPAAFEDCIRAVQFLRFRAPEWKLDPARFGVFGGSAGAQISMYLAFHDDLGDVKSADPIARQSTRVVCVATNGGQITLDLDWWTKHVPECNIDRTDPRKQFGVKTMAEAKPKIDSIAAINLISSDDPPIFMSYGMAPGQPYPADQQTAINWKFHHVIHGIELKKLADSLGLESHLKYPGAKTRYKSIAGFLSAKLLSGAAGK